MKFIKNINEYYEGYNSIINNTCIFLKLNIGINFEDVQNQKVWLINGKFSKCNYDIFGLVHTNKIFDRNGNEIY
jgi:hypothetical protein